MDCARLAEALSGARGKQEVFRRAHEHRGAAFVEVYQNCNVFNDGAYADLLSRDHRADMLIPLEHGQPIRFGAGEFRL